MANMSYCRFQNTYRDLIDCYDNLNDSLRSESEKLYRARLVELCQSIVDEFNPEEEEDFDDEE
jgi:hypothetical protein